jgi:DNA-binding NarL/FixJ family response regulator
MPGTAYRNSGRNGEDVTLLNLRLPDSDGLSLLATMGDITRDARIAVLTMSESDADILRVLKARAAAYILTSSPRDEILGTIRTVHSRDKRISLAIAERLADQVGEEQLMARELEVCRLIRDDYRDKQIAGVLCIAETTVNFHAKNFFDKLNANDRTYAVTLAVRYGLL